MSETGIHETGKQALEMHENPLVPHVKLRQMYAAMTRARLLDEHIGGLRKGVKGRWRMDSTRGQEGCRVSTAIDLGPGDLVSDSQRGVVMELLTGTKMDSLLKRVAAIHSGKKAGRATTAGARVLPWIEDAGERLRMAMGAALSFKALGQPNVVVAYVRHGEVSKGTWRRMLGLASKLELPIIFVVLPAVKGEKKTGMGNLSAKTGAWGVPGIPVDAGDAVALYRVAQESMGRTRGGDGPVLIECVGYRADGKERAAAVDPLAQMQAFLLNRKVCTKAWLDGAAESARKQIAAAKQ